MVNQIRAIDKLLGLQDLLMTVDIQQIRAEINFSMNSIFGLAESWEEEKKNEIHVEENKITFSF